MRILFATMTTMVTTIATATLADSPAPHGYLLSVWTGALSNETHSIVPFEGENAYERCLAAVEALRTHDNHPYSEYAICIPF